LNRELTNTQTSNALEYYLTNLTTRLKASDLNTENTLKYLMHVCIVSPRLYHYLNNKSKTIAGGAQRQQYLIAHKLQQRGFEVSAVVADYGQPHRVQYNGIQTLIGVPETLSSPAQIPSVIYSLLTSMKRSQADVFYVRGAPRLTAAVYVLSTVLQKPFVFNLANDRDVDDDYLIDRYNPLLRRTYYRAIDAADAVIAQTNTQQQQIELIFDRESIHIPNGYPVPDSSELIDHSNRKEVLWVGTSDEHQKKPLRFVELAESHPDIPFVMISRPKTGDPEYHNKVAQRAAAIPNLEFTGPVDPDKIHEYYRRAALFVNTSDYEGFPNTFLEAWRYATPVLSLHYEVDDNFSTFGLGAKTGSMDQMKQQIRLLHDDPVQRNEMGQAAREYMSQNYSIDSIATKFQSVFESVCTG